MIFKTIDSEYQQALSTSLGGGEDRDPPIARRVAALREYPAFPCGLPIGLSRWTRELILKNSGY